MTNDTLLQWGVGSFSNKLGFISSDINWSCTRTINDSTSWKYISTSWKSSFYEQKYMFRRVKGSHSTRGKTFPQCNELCTRNITIFPTEITNVSKLLISLSDKLGFTS